MILQKRAAGLLLHPTSLPGAYGIGHIGSVARRWIDDLVRGGIKWWQVLPLGPTGFGDSPYQSFSAFAGNPLLIDLQLLQEDGWLREHLVDHDDFDSRRVDYEKVRAYKLPLLRAAKGYPLLM